MKISKNAFGQAFCVAACVALAACSESSQSAAAPVVPVAEAVATSAVADDVELVFGACVPKGTVPVFTNGGGVDAYVYRPSRGATDGETLERPPRSVPVLNSDGDVLCYAYRAEGGAAIQCPKGKVPVIENGVAARFAPLPKDGEPFVCPPETGVIADSSGEILCYFVIPDVGAAPVAPAETVPVFTDARDGMLTNGNRVHRPSRPSTDGKTVERPARTVPVLDSDGFVLCYVYRPEGGAAIQCPKGKIPVIEKGDVAGFEPRPADKKPERGAPVGLDTTEDGKIIDRDGDGVALCLYSPVAPETTGGGYYCCNAIGFFFFDDAELVPVRLAGGKALLRWDEKMVPVLDSDGEFLGWVCDSGNKAIIAPSGRVPVIDAKGGVERFVSKDAEAPPGTVAVCNHDGDVFFFNSERECVPVPPVEAVPAAPVAITYKTAERIGDVAPNVWRNSIGMEFRLIPVGKFMMGSPETEDKRECWGSDETRREVEIARDFYMSVYETRQRDYAALRYGADGQSLFYNPSRFKGDDRPVDGVHWLDAMFFAATLNKYLGKELAERFGEGARYDLPTEAQWEYACRAGSETAYSFGSSLNGVKANVSGDRPYGTNRPGPTLGETTEVGKYKPNAWGLYDMHGNVWEWCLDWYAPYDVSDTVDPVNLTGRGANRVLRGGAWRYDCWSARAANRVNDSDVVWETAKDSVGFRLIIVPGSEKPLVEKYGDAQAEEIAKRQREEFEKSRTANAQ